MVKELRLHDGNMDVSYDLDTETMTINSTEVQLPNHLYDDRVFGNVLVVALSIGDEQNEDPDIPPVDLPRNLVGLNASGHRWTVERDPDQSTSEHYTRIYDVLSRCICLRNENGWAEIDPETGVVIETYPRDQFQIGDTVVEFPEYIDSFYTFDDIVLVVEGGGFRSNVSAFDFEGNRIWRREILSPSFHTKNGKLLSKAEFGMGAYVYLEHDPETGKPVAISQTPIDDREKLLSLLPADHSHLTDDYL